MGEKLYMEIQEAKKAYEARRLLDARQDGMVALDSRDSKAGTEGKADPEHSETDQPASLFETPSHEEIIEDYNAQRWHEIVMLCILAMVLAACLIGIMSFISDDTDSDVELSLV